MATDQPAPEFVASARAACEAVAVALGSAEGAGLEVHDLPRMALETVARWVDAGCPPRPAPACLDVLARWGQAMHAELRRASALPGVTAAQRAMAVRLLDAARALAALPNVAAAAGGGAADPRAAVLRGAVGAACFALAERGYPPDEAWAMGMQTYYGAGGVIPL